MASAESVTTAAICNGIVAGMRDGNVDAVRTFALALGHFALSVIVEWCECARDEDLLAA